MNFVTNLKYARFAFVVLVGLACSAVLAAALFLSGAL